MAEKPEIFSHPIRKLTLEEIERVSGGKARLVAQASDPKAVRDMDNQLGSFALN